MVISHGIFVVGGFIVVVGGWWRVGGDRGQIDGRSREMIVGGSGRSVRVVGGRGWWWGGDGVVVSHRIFRGRGRNS